MTIYHGVVSNNGVDDVVHCDRLDEFFKEFIEYRKWKVKVSNSNKEIFPFYWKKYSEDNYWEIFYLDLNFDNAINREAKKPVVYWEKPSSESSCFDYSTGWDLGLNVSALKWKKTCLSEWNQQKDKIEKVLQDTWETGEIKDTYGLDLGWPNNEQVKATENPVLEPKNKKDKSINEQPSQANNKIYWIIGSLVLVSLIGITIWFVLWKKLKSK